uniref:Ionotropic glutamate receptor L-glutamate and glycine-binding domain-containing protein n=1 Tax=Stomoxys calcitrans TaxID=35570 RepID=A0A454A0P2_STOCA
TISPITMGHFSTSLASRQIQNDLMDEILRRTMNPHGIIRYLVEGETYPILESQRYMNKEGLGELYYKYYTNREKSIWFIDSLKAYKNFEKNLLDKNRNYQRNGFFLLVYTGHECDCMTSFKQIFKRLFELYVTNVNILLMIGKHAYLYTYFPFRTHKCHSFEPEMYISFRGIENNGNFSTAKSFYPSKVINMHGCPLTIVTWNFPPYIFVDRDESTGKLLALRGLEGSLITLMAERMNFTIEIKTPKQLNIGEVFENGTVTGALGMVANREANITIFSYVYTAARSEAMLASESYTTIPYVLAIAKGRPLTPFERLVKPFHYIIWICYSSTLFIAVVFIYMLRFIGKTRIINLVQGDHNQTPLTYLLSILYGISIHNNIPYGNFARFLFNSWVLYNLVLRSAYNGELFKMLHDGTTHNDIKTIEQVVQKNYTIYTFASLAEIIKQIHPKANLKPFQGNYSLESTMQRIGDENNQEKIAVCLLKLTIQYYNQMNPTKRVRILPQILLTSPLIFFMPRHSFLRLRAASFVLKTRQSGLMKRYRTLIVYAASKKQRQHGDAANLSMSVLMGLFYIYGVLMILCSFVFILEMLSERYRKLQILLDFLNI